MSTYSCFLATLKRQAMSVYWVILLLYATNDPALKPGTISLKPPISVPLNFIFLDALRLRLDRVIHHQPLHCGREYSDGYEHRQAQ